MHDGTRSKFGAHPSMTTHPNPTPKVIIQELMQYLAKEMVEVETPNNEAMIRKTYSKYACPKPRCQVAEVNSLDKTGYKNPFSHLKTYYGGDLPPSKLDELIMRMYHDTVKDEETKGDSIRSHFAIHAASPYDGAIYLYLRLIAMK